MWDSPFSPAWTCARAAATASLPVPRFLVALCEPGSQVVEPRGPSRVGTVGARAQVRALQCRPPPALADVLLKESPWTQMFFGEGQAALSFSQLSKDDEGLYTLRIVSRGGVSEHRAFLFVRGRWALAVGDPGARGGWGWGPREMQAGGQGGAMVHCPVASRALQGVGIVGSVSRSSELLVAGDGAGPVPLRVVAAEVPMGSGFRLGSGLGTEVWAALWVPPPPSFSFRAAPHSSPPLHRGHHQRDD